MQIDEIVSCSLPLPSALQYFVNTWKLENQCVFLVRLNLIPVVARRDDDHDDSDGDFGTDIPFMNFSFCEKLRLIIISAPLCEVHESYVIL